MPGREVAQVAARPFTRFDNEILGKLARLSASGIQLRVLLFVIRHTFGFHRPSTRPFSVRYLSRELGTPLSATQRAVAGLLGSGLLHREAADQKGASWQLGERLINPQADPKRGHQGTEATPGAVTTDLKRGHPHPHRERKEKEVRGARNGPSSTPSPNSDVVQFETNGKAKSWAPPAALLAELTAAFPGLNVSAEVLKARVWCEVNPKRRKTADGMPAFLFRWMGRSNNGLGRRTVRDGDDDFGPVTASGSRDGSDRIPDGVFA